MRRWPGFESRGAVADHVIRHLPRDYPIFRRMKPGDEYPQAHRHARELLRERLEELRHRGMAPHEGSAEYERLLKTIVPAYDPGKFPNK